MDSLAVTTGSLVLLVGFVILVFAVAYGLYTARGSGISGHRHADQRAPGADGPLDEAGVDEGDGSELNQRGTR